MYKNNLQKQFAISELVEDKPIDLQQAEEIPEDDTNVPKRPNRESRSQSSNK